MQFKILIAGRDKESLSTLARQLPSSNYDVAIRHINNGHADPLHDVADLPDLLIFHIDESHEAELNCLVERPAQLRPTILVIGPGGNTRLMRLAMKAGAIDYLEHPASALDVSHALYEVRKSFAHGDGETDGQLIAVVSAKGGSGASFVSANLGHMIKTVSDKSTALIDLDLQYASLGQYLDVRSEHGLMQALDVIEDLDATALNAYMAKHASGLSLLGPLKDEIVLTRDVPLDRLARLLELTKAHYDYTLVDQPRDLHDVSAAVYERADRVLIVMQQELANLRDASRLRQILMTELAMPEDRITVLLNRYDKKAALEVSDICRTVGVEKNELVMLPNDYRDVAQSVNIGVPMLDHSRNSAVTKALMRLESRLTGVAANPADTGLFSKAFATFKRS